MHHRSHDWHPEGSASRGLPRGGGGGCLHPRESAFVGSASGILEGSASKGEGGSIQGVFLRGGGESGRESARTRKVEIHILLECFLTQFCFQTFSNKSVHQYLNVRKHYTFCYQRFENKTQLRILTTTGFRTILNKSRHLHLNVGHYWLLWAFHMYRNIMKSGEMKHEMTLFHTVRRNRNVLF